MKPENCGIYEFTCLPTGKKYIGASMALDSRHRAHRADLENNRHHNKFFQKEWNKYGASNFVFQIIEVCDKSVMFEREAFHIKKFKSKCYNTTHSEKKDEDGKVGKDLPGTKRYKISG